MSTKRLQVWQCARIKALRDAGWKICDIASDINCTERTVLYQLRKISETNKFEQRERSGRPPILSESEKRFIAVLSKRDRFKSARLVRDEVTPIIPKAFSKDTVNRVLNEHGLFGCKAARRPTISPVNKMKRLAFAREHVNWTDEQWGNVLFTDESKFQIFGTNMDQYVRREVGTRYSPENTVGTVKHGGGNVMVWGGICVNGTTKLHWIQKIMDKNVYHDILVRIAVKAGRHLIGQDYIFQEDNDPKHSARLNRNYLGKLEERGILRRMVWPPQSPDLNPIEHIWAHIDRVIDKSAVTSKSTLFAELENVWDNIDSELLRRYIRSMRRRCLAVIRARGNATKY